MNKKMSPKQIEANRRNAQKSTGPKTPQGRAISKMNALKHGILSKEVVVRGWCIKENGREFAALHRRLWEDLKPVGLLEEMLVDKIVGTHWRLRRALKAESGEIALSVDKGHWERSRSDECSHWWLNPYKDPVSSLEHSAFGNVIMLDWLMKVRERVEQDGELTEAAIKIPFDGERNTLSIGLEKLRQRLLQKPGGADPAAGRKENKNQALRAIDLRLESLERRRAECKKREDKEEEARQAAAVLPSPEVLDKIMRYETKLLRQLHRAMNQLERLQRRRLGEAVPPPLVMVVSP